MFQTEFKEKYPHIIATENGLLKDYTYTKTGGAAELLVFPKTKDELHHILTFTKEKNIALTILGNASNVIVKDSGLSGIVVMLEKMNDISIDGEKVYAQAGAKLVDVSQFIQKHTLTGFEFACGIPGSVGGAVYMNAGAYDGEMKDVIVSVDVLTRDGEMKTYTNEDMQFAYRHSKIQETGDVVVSMTLQLAVGQQNLIDEKIKKLTDLRQSKQPLEYPSCGSVFKRPEGYFAGKLIQDAQLQGYRIGGVEVSKKHAGFMVNVDNGTASDYEALIKHVQNTVKKQFNVELETEVRFIGK
ncbi:UDP-N-acetylmuramate dehydrogenase [Carnobacteriaceae bacterium zg-ZUI240]|nr:UDP-N-acetylmuramate dehydrogenase [Carnobacteriaceae bacterium zg-ZUI240]